MQHLIVPRLYLLSVLLDISKIAANFQRKKTLITWGSFSLWHKMCREHGAGGSSKFGASGLVNTWVEQG